MRLDPVDGRGRITPCDAVRILAAADIHGRHDVYAWLVDVARERQPFAVILAGDLLGFPDGFETVETAQEANRRQALAALERLTQPFFYIMGNDDWVDLHGAHVHGHVHHLFGHTGRHFNVASGGRKRAMLIDLETMEHELITG